VDASKIYNHACRLCDLCDVGNKWVCLPGRGNPDSRALIVGEAPGATEDETGQPFVGLSGKLLTEALVSCDILTFEDTPYITNAVKCRPPNNNTPNHEEVEACFPYLDEEVASINPVAMLLLGNVPLYSVTREKGGITRKAGIWRRIAGPHGDILVMPNYHPAYVKRYPDKEDFFKEVVDDFVQVWKYGLKHSVEDTWKYARP
jgi:uracil-DNA glycosylase family 4